VPAAAEAAAASPARPVGRTDVDLDDVIVAWAEILPRLPPATRAAAQEAQPIALYDDVITFGVPENVRAAAEPRFKKEAENIRTALTERLGRRMQFKLSAVAGFGALPAPPAPGGGGTVDAARQAEREPDDDDVVDLGELTDVPPPGAAVDSVGLFTSRFDATVVEELPRE
jgi:hypothetical protein